MLLHLHISFHYFDFFHFARLRFYYFGECIIKWQYYAPLLHFVLCLYLLIAGRRNDCQAMYTTHLPAKTLELTCLHVLMWMSGWCIVMLRESSLHVKFILFQGALRILWRLLQIQFQSQGCPYRAIQ